MDDERHEEISFKEKIRGRCRYDRICTQSERDLPPLDEQPPHGAVREHDAANCETGQTCDVTPEIEHAEAEGREDRGAGDFDVETESAQRVRSVCVTENVGGGARYG